MSDQTTNKSADKKILEPTFHFETKQIKIGEDYTTDTIPVSELVRAGQRLVDFPNFDKLKDKGYRKAFIEPGDFASENENEHSIIASVFGYPKIRKIRRPDTEGMISVLSVEPLLKFSPDNMTVGLNIHPPIEGVHSLQQEDLRQLIADHGICYGIIDTAIEEAEEFIKSGHAEFRTIIVAKGKPVGQSSDAYLRFDMEIGPIAGKILDDGSIDFRERKVMVPVSAGQTIATKIPPVQGSSGIDVFGEETPAAEGKDIKIELLNDVKYSNTTKLVTATRDGVLSIVNNNVIKVCSHQIIYGDIDYEIGNIESMNSVTVQGSVQPSFKVLVAGDLKITGSVMGGILSSESNIVVLGGITGKSSILTAKGDTDINFIEQGKLSSGGLVVIRKQSYYSEIESSGDIRCHASSVVLGGRLIAAGSITLGDVGGEESVPSLIAAGVVAERYDHYIELKEKVIQQQDEIIQWLQRYRGSSHSKKVRKMEQDLENSKQLLLRVNMIPGTGKYSRVAAMDEAQKNHPDFSNTDAIDIGRITIDVVGTIMAGTQLQIGNVNMRLDKTISTRRFKLHSNLKRILAIPLKK